LDRFPGYLRRDGRAGVRNHVLILPSVICAAHTAMEIAQHVPGTVGVCHQHGCAQVGPDAEQTFRTLAGTGASPNVFGVVVVGLGCESISAERLAAAIAETGKPVEVVMIQEQGGSRRAAAVGARLAERLVEASRQVERQPLNVSELVVGTECGGSDAFSGLSANPGMGAAADLFVAAGATVILTETTELIGAEHVLMRRARSREVAEDIERIVRRMEEAAPSGGLGSVRALAPGNIEGGLTTIEEKSLGCIGKGGTTPVQQVMEYAERPTRRGLVIMDGPGQDGESVSGLAAAGAQIVLFSTGRGTPLGAVVAPVIKVASTGELYRRMRDNMDVNAGTVLEGRETAEELGRRLYERTLRVAGGDLTRSEEVGHREFAIARTWRTL
jgi:altronate dehydratase large subunit